MGTRGANSNSSENLGQNLSGMKRIALFLVRIAFTLSRKYDMPTAP